MEHISAKFLASLAQNQVFSVFIIIDVKNIEQEVELVLCWCAC